MTPTRYVVEWRIPQLTGDQVYQQEYDSREVADSNAQDIAGYEGVVLIGVRETRTAAWEHLVQR